MLPSMRYWFEQSGSSLFVELQTLYEVFSSKTKVLHH